MIILEQRRLDDVLKDSVSVKGISEVCEEMAHSEKVYIPGAWCSLGAG